MNSVKDFKKNFVQLYRNGLVEKLAVFEQERKDVLLKCILYSILCLGLLIFDMYYTANSEKLFPLLSIKAQDYIGGFFYLITILIGFIPSTMAKSFENRIKEKTMPLILECLDSFKWDCSEVINDEFINDFHLFKFFNTRETDDNFAGLYKGVKIEISETELSEVHGSGKSRTCYTRFKGVLISLKVDKEYKGTTFILQKDIVGFARKMSNLQEVNLEDIEFEKKFNVYSDDQIEARCLLTTSFIERFKNLGFSFNASRIEAGFRGHDILIGIWTCKDLFRVANLFRPIYDYAQFKKMVDEFASLLELIDELKLDVNIGM